MRSARGQGTVEYVGVLVLVAVLIGAVAGSFGVPGLTTGITSSIGRALLEAIGAARPGHAVASPDERARFSAAIDASVPADDRGTLHDLRLALIAAHGDARGREIYRTLVVDDLRRVVPGLARPTTFGSASHVLLPHATGEVFVRAREAGSLLAPIRDDPGEVETPLGTPNAHVITIDEADRATSEALHPGFSWKTFALDAIGIVPIAGAGLGVKRLLLVAQKAAWASSEYTGGIAVYGDARPLLAASEATLAPGTREGDELVSWIASRRPVRGGAARLYARSAVVRSGVVVSQGIQALPAGVRMRP